MLPSACIFKRACSSLNQCKILISRMMSSTSEDDVILTQVKDKGIITLNRPKALNALNLSMIEKILPQLTKWNSDPEMSMVIIKGTGEKAFCAGGDVRAIAEDKGGTSGSEFFRKEYTLNNLIGTLAVPYVAFLDGITMGGGVGLSVHGNFRVATERSVFAMPETAIGFFPDVGGSYFLPRLPGKLGTYLALTGCRLTGRDVFKGCVATHFVTSQQLKFIEQDLLNLKKPSVSDIDGVISKYHEQAEVDYKKEFSLKHYTGKINNVFDGKTVEEIFRRLDKDGSEWAKTQLETLMKMSPTSLKVTLQELLLGSKLSLQEALQMEYRMARRFMEGNDFFEGVKAALIDRTNQPKWNPPKIEDVSKELVDRYFEPLEKDEELALS